MTAAMNVGTLVGYLTLDDKGIDKGLSSAVGKIQGFSNSGAQAASKAGSAVGNAMASGYQGGANRLSGMMSASLQQATKQVDQLGAQGQKAIQLLKGPPEQLAAVAKASGKSVEQVTAELKGTAKAAKDAGIAVEEGGSKIKNTLQRLSIYAGAAGLAGVFKKTIDLGLDFTTQLNDLQAVSGATASQMAKVSQTAKDLGNAVDIPATSASDAAEAMTELAKGGLSVQQSMDAAKGTLQLAAAASISGAQAATIQANALNVFHLKATDAGHVADVLANTANAANGDITDFAQAMQQAGGVASGFGWTMDETATMLGLLAKNGMIGSDAGTSLKASFLQLATPSKQAKQAIQALGLQVYDSNGKFISAKDLTDQLSKAQKRMSDQAFQSAAGILFGSDAIRTVINVAREGAAGYDDMGKKIEKVNGVVDLAGAKMQGLPGAIQKAENALQGAALDAYDALAPLLETGVNGFAGLVTGISDTVGWLGKLPGPVKAFGISLAALAIANKVGLLGKLSSAFDSVRLRAMVARDSIRSISFASITAGAKSAGKSLLGMFGGPWGIAIAAAPVAIDLLGKAFSANRRPVKDFSAAIDENTGKLRENADAAVADAIKSDLLKWKKLGGDVGIYTAAVEGNTAAQAKMQGQLAQMYAARIKDTDAWQSYGKALEAAGISLHDVAVATSTGDPTKLLAIKAALKDITGGIAPASTALDQFGNATGDLTGITNAYAGSVSDMNGQLGEAKVTAEAIAGAQKANSAATKDATTATNDASAAQQRYLDFLYRRAYVDQAATSDTKDQVTAYNDARSALNDYGEIAEVVQAKVQAFAETSSRNVRDTADAFDAAHDKALTFAGSIDEVKAAMDRMSGKTPDVEEATRRFNGAMTAAKDAVKDTDGNVEKYSATLIKTNGVIDTTSKKGQQLYDSVTQQADAAKDLALAQADVAGQTGGVTAAADAASKSLQQSRQDFIDNAKQMGLTKEEAKKLADAYFGLPKDIKIQVYGVDDFSAVDAKLQALQDNTIKVDVLGQYKGTRGLPANYTGGPNGGLASGGPALPGRSYWVGENGPEILTMNPGSGGYVTNAKDSAAFKALNLPGRAIGGPVGNYSAPSVAALAGIQPKDLGPVLSVVASALTQFRGAVSATGQAVKDSAKDAKDAASSYKQQLKSQHDTAQQQAKLVKQANEQSQQRIIDAKAALKATKADQKERINDAKVALGRAQYDRKAAIAEAEAGVRAAKKRLAAADSDSERKSARSAIASAEKKLSDAESSHSSAARRVADAQKSLARAQVDQAKAIKDAEKKLADARKDRIEQVRGAIRAQTAANKAEAAKTAEARKAYAQATREVAQAKARAQATEKLAKASAGVLKEQSKLANQLDKTNASIDAAKNKLSGLKDASAQLSSSISSKLVGDTSIMNLDANGVGGLISGLRSNLNVAKGFRSNLATLAKAGLDNDILQQVAGGGLAASPLAKALAAAPGSQIKQLNSLQAQIRSVTTGTGNLVANAEYSPLIKQQKEVVAAQKATAKSIQQLMSRIGTELTKAQRESLKGIAFKLSIDGKEIDARVTQILATEARKLDSIR